MNINAKERVLKEVMKELEDLYNIPRIKGFTYQVTVNVNDVPTVCYSIEKIIMPEQNHKAR